MQVIQIKYHPYVILIFLVGFLLMVSCSDGRKVKQTETKKETQPVEPVEIDPLKNKGIGPISEVVLAPIDSSLVDEGKALYEQLCIACHKIDEDFEGPAPIGILERRTPEWVMNMIMNPEEMTEKDPIAKQLKMERNGATMTDHNVSETEARKILEYFRTL